MARRLTFILCLLSLAAGGRAQTSAATLFAPVPLATTPLAEGALIVSEESARRALALGFTSTAAAQAEQLVAESEAGSPERDAAALILTAARLEMGDVVGALRALGNHGESRPPAYRLRAGLLAAREGRIAAAQAELAQLRPEILPEGERAWLYLLQGMVAEAARDTPKAGAAYDQALAAATSDWQRARLRLARERLRLEQGEASQEQADELLKQAERYAGRGVGTDYAVQYAVALTTLGRRQDAVAWLEAQLPALSDSTLAGSRDDVRLMLGLVAGPGRPAGLAALEQLLATGADPMKQRMALQLLAETTETAEARNRLRRVLDELLLREPAHPLEPEMLLARAELSLADQAYNRAEADAKELLARFPNSPLKARALTQLAAVAWELNRFRTAADYAAQAATAATGDEAARASLRLLAAEASYRAGDYAAAADVYAGLAGSPPAGVPAAEVLFQQVMAVIEAGRLGQAAELIDRLSADPRLDATTRWRAEWNLARALQAAGQREVALARVSRLRAEPDSTERPAALRVRLAWLEARLAREAGREEDALRLALAIPSSLAGVEAPLAREVAGLARLVAAEALFNLDRADEAVAELKKLREDMPGSEAALQSFIVEADIRATAGGLADAQALLTRFADDYRDNPYAPYALFQAALNAERRGDDEAYREAYVLLERLVTDYPRDEQVFAARMKQGDLLRRLNQFPQAQQIYDLLVNRFSGNPGVLDAQMALADCHRAQAAQDASHFESALTILERLRDLANASPDLRIEAGYKLGDMLAPTRPEEALAAWGPVAEAMVADRDRAAALGARGRYWAGRLLARMAGLLEARGRPDEAREAWRLLADRGLPGAATARARLGAAEAGR